MSKLIKSVSPETLQSWGVAPDSQIEYYDGTILVIDDVERILDTGNMPQRRYEGTYRALIPTKRKT